MTTDGQWHLTMTVIHDHKRGREREQFCHSCKGLSLVFVEELNKMTEVLLPANMGFPCRFRAKCSLLHFLCISTKVICLLSWNRHPISLWGRRIYIELYSIKRKAFFLAAKSTFNNGQSIGATRDLSGKLLWDWRLFEWIVKPDGYLFLNAWRKTKLRHSVKLNKCFVGSFQFRANATFKLADNLPKMTRKTYISCTLSSLIEGKHANEVVLPTLPLPYLILIQGE